MRAEFGQLFINHPDKALSVCRIFISKNFPEREKLLGKLFGLIQIETDQPDKRKYQIADAIINQLENAFYYHPALESLPLNQPPEKINSEQIFEGALRKINDQIINLIHGPEIYLPISRLHLLFGVIKEGHLYFTVSGQMQAFLIFKGKHDDYKMINIIEGNKEVISKSNRPKSESLKIFSSIISGRARINDSFLFSNNELFDYLSFDRLKKNIITHSPAEAVASFRAILSGVSSYVTFAALIIKLLPDQNELAKEEIVQPQQSIKELIKTKEKTEKLLSPSLKSSLKRYSLAIKNYSKSLLGRLAKKPLGRPAEETLTTSSLKIENQAQPLLQRWQLIKFLKSRPELVDQKKPTQPTEQTAARIKVISDQTENKIKPLDRLARKIIISLGLILDNLIKKFNRRSKTNKFLLIAFLILGFLFLQSLVYQSAKQSYETNLSAYNELVTEISNKRDEAEAAIIYNNESKARSLVLEAEGLLTKLPQSTKQEKETSDSLRADLAALLLKLRHVVNVPEPLLIVNFASLVPAGNNINIPSLINLNNTIYAYATNSNSNSIYQLDLNKNQIIDLGLKADNFKPFKLGRVEDQNSLLFLSESGELVKLDLKTKSFNLINFPLPTNSKLVDFDIYRGRLYSLDIGTNQIYRQGITAQGISRGLVWLKDKGIDLTRATSFSVTNSIYVSKSNGEIDKFINGRRQSFEPQNIDPALNQPTKIWFSPDSRDLYLLEPAGKRLVVLDKDGQLKAQYYSDQFDDLKDLVVNESEKKIYLLNGTKLFGLRATHL